MAYNLAYTTVTEDVELDWTANTTQSDEHGLLAKVGTQLCHFKNGLNYQTLDTGTNTWVDVAYTTIGLTGSQKFLAKVVTDDGVLLINNEGDVVEVTTGSYTAIGKVAIP